MAQAQPSELLRQSSMRMKKTNQDHHSKANSLISAIGISTLIINSEAVHQKPTMTATQMPFFANMPDDLLTMEQLTTETMQESSLLIWTMLLPFGEESWRPTYAWQAWFEDLFPWSNCQPECLLQLVFILHAMWNTQQCSAPPPLKHLVTTLHSNIPVHPPFLTDNRQQWTATLLEHLTTSLGIDINTIATHGIAQASASDDALQSEHHGTNPAGSGSVPGSQNKTPWANSYWTGVTTFYICMLQAP